MEIEQKLDKMGVAFEDFKKINDKREEEIKRLGQANADTLEKLGKANDHLNKLEAEIKEARTALERSNRNDDQEQQLADGETKASMQYKEAYDRFMRKGSDMSAEEIKAGEQTFREAKYAQVRVDEDGGYWVRPQLSTQIIKNITDISPLRSLANVETISTDALEIADDSGIVTSGWVGETEPRPETSTPKLGLLTIPVHEIYAMPAATQKLLDDASVNIESWLAGKVSDTFAIQEGVAFLKGDGFKKPKGILAYDSGTGAGQMETMATAGVNAVTGDDLINLQGLLKTRFANNAKWLLSRALITKVRLLKDAEGRYIWAPGLTSATPNSLLDKPYEIDDNLTTAVGEVAAVYGDFKQGYTIIDRTGIRMLRDPYTKKPFVLFYTTKRVGGGATNLQALKRLQVKAS